MSVGSQRPAIRLLPRDTKVHRPTPVVPRLKTVWFDDGNLIVNAGTAKFKVYLGLLAKRSVIFKDMLVTAQPDSSDDLDTMEPCSSVTLTDDPIVLSHFLAALFGEP
jgi:hypothetical protein